MKKKRHNPDKPQNKYGGDYDCINYDESNTGREFCHDEGQAGWNEWIKWCKENPAKVKARGKKCRAENHYNWKGGILNIGQSIRRMWECEKWRDDVKARDQKCQLCGSVKNLESHHIIPIQMIIEIFQIKNREDARNCKELWDIKNGVTLCRKCHYKLHGRKYAEY